LGNRAEQNDVEAKRNGSAARSGPRRQAKRKGPAQSLRRAQP